MTSKMTINKYQGKTKEEAIEKAKQELGEGAVVLAELLCLVIGCAMVVPPVYFPLIGIVCQIFSIFIRSFSKELLEWADAPYDSNPNYPEQLIHKIVTVHRYCSPFPHRSSSFICSSYSSVGLYSFSIENRYFSCSSFGSVFSIS